MLHRSYKGFTKGFIKKHAREKTVVVKTKITP